MYKAIVFDFFGVFCTPMATNWFKRRYPITKQEGGVSGAVYSERLGKLTRCGVLTKRLPELADVTVADVEKGIDRSNY